MRRYRLDLGKRFPYAPAQSILEGPCVESDASKAARMANGKRAWEDAHFSRNFPQGCDSDECQVCQDLWFFAGRLNT